MAYALTGWGLSLVVLAVYAVRLVRRGRRLAEQVPPSERRWSA